MGEFRYVPSDEVAARHRASERTPTRPRQQPTRAVPASPAPKQRNVEQVLSLGAVRFFTFRGRTYRIPPVPYKLGQKVLHLHTDILADARLVAMTGERKSADAFYRKMDRLAKVLWTHIRPLGKMRRFFWRMGLMTNPFRGASEEEIREITDFFLQGRMTSSVRSMSETEAQA